jgi:hypothetical protein
MGETSGEKEWPSSQKSRVTGNFGRTWSLVEAERREGAEKSAQLRHKAEAGPLHLIHVGALLLLRHLIHVGALLLLRSNESAPQLSTR